MELIQLLERIHKKQPFKSNHGTVHRIFEIHERNSLNHYGQPYVFIKPESPEKKIKKALN